MATYSAKDREIQHRYRLKKMEETAKTSYEVFPSKAKYYQEHKKEIIAAQTLRRKALALTKSQTT